MRRPKTYLWLVLWLAPLVTSQTLAWNILEVPGELMGDITDLFWLFRYVITASIHGHFRPMPHESASYSRGYKHTHPALEGRQARSAGVALRQHLQQCLGLLQIGGVKALGEPGVDRCQQLTGFDALALLLPQPTQAHGGSQL